MGHANRPRFYHVVGLDAQSRRVRVPTGRWWGDSNSDTYGYGCAYSYSNTYSYGHSHTYGDTNTNSYFSSKVNSDATAAPNTVPSPVSPDSQVLSEK